MERNEEIERRFIVKSIDPDILRATNKRTIRQAYCEYPLGLRVRITEFPGGGEVAQMTHKTGHRNLQRIEENQSLSVPAAKFLHDLWPKRIKKTRYVREGWEIDFFEGPLLGLVLAEFEMDNLEQAVVQPDWIGSWVEVTELVTNLFLAQLSESIITLPPDQTMNDWVYEQSLKSAV